MRASKTIDTCSVFTTMRSPYQTTNAIAQEQAGALPEYVLPLKQVKAKEPH
jgi:hypothetical protein